MITQEALDFLEMCESDVVEYIKTLREEARRYKNYRTEYGGYSKDNCMGNKNGQTSYSEGRNVEQNKSKCDRNGHQKGDKNRQLRPNPGYKKEGRRKFILAECEWTSRKEAEQLLRIKQKIEI